MSGPVVIKNLDGVLKDTLGDSKIVDYNTRYLTAQGDNYGSVMLALDLTVQKNGTKEVIHTIAKCIPENEYLRGVFHIQQTSKKELFMYRDTAPALRELQKEYGVPDDKLLNVHAKFYGGRFNLNDSDEVDEDAVLILENLAVQGYSTSNRLKGFDLDESKLLLENLARFHAVPIALKILKPEKFKTDVYPSVKPTYLGSEEYDRHMKNFSVELREFFSTIKDFKPYVDKVAELVSESALFPQNFLKSNEPIATTMHNDFWVNNLLLLKENGKPTKAKFVDFQVTTYGSPVRDVLFFFFTSVNHLVLQDHFDELYEWYHKNFIETLQYFKLDLNLFSREVFDKEMEQFAIAELGHIFMIMWAVLTDKEKIKQVEIDKSMFTIETVDPIFYTKAIICLREYVKRGWLKL